MEKKYLAIDYGTRRTGLALGIAGIALPHTVIPTSDSIPTIQRLIGERSITTLIIGMPTHMDGRICEHGRRVELWVKELRKSIPLIIEIILWDERTSTMDARHSLDAVGVDSQGTVDDIAACVFLQEYLDTIPSIS